MFIALLYQNCRDYPQHELLVSFISVSNGGGHVRLKLNGDFDGSSACELANLIHNGGLSKTSSILIDTDSVKKVFPFGVDVLHSRLQNAKHGSPDLNFTGKQSVRLAPR